ncbi:predicted protein [Lichtheimia corymbifera JMRC:FSU:9682]|uniref:Uncharacterized protein n=1 Tax=Lichtheimia corymbifera JMRC:FSU:9682 TaxID=1263082 RepID=A0A068RQT4_9FUNG|nr:predicted protein [Lichtheimia corymbifera JMRC:FSU:9682]
MPIITSMQSIVHVPHLHAKLDGCTVNGHHSHTHRLYDQLHSHPLDWSINDSNSSLSRKQLYIASVQHSVHYQLWKTYWLFHVIVDYCFWPLHCRVVDREATTRTCHSSSPPTTRSATTSINY